MRTNVLSRAACACVLSAIAFQAQAATYLVEDLGALRTSDIIWPDQ